MSILIYNLITKYINFLVKFINNTFFNLIHLTHLLNNISTNPLNKYS